MASERFLITGAYGCVGAWAVKRLVDEGIPVWTYDLPGDPHRFRLAMSDEAVAAVNVATGDITDADAFERVVADNGITHIIHLAALQVPFVRANPVGGAAVNVVGTTVVLETAHRHADQVRGLAFASSFGVYIAAGGRQSPLGALLSVFRLPLIYSLILALAIANLKIPLPETFLETATLVGKAGPQVAMVVLGIQISRLHRGGRGSLPLYSGVFAKLLLVPALGIGLAFLLRTEEIVRDTLLVYACLPTAINALLLSLRFNVRPDLVGGIIFGSTLLSPLTITAILLWIGS